MPQGRYAALFMALCFLGLTGCGQAQTPLEESESSQVQVVDTADPEAALDAIYQDCEIRGVEKATIRILRDQFYINPDQIVDYYVRYSSGRYGLADVFILKPEAGEELAVRESLEQVKLSRIKEFESYDIYNAYQIAQDAEIFSQGGYEIMLMVEDLEAAREAIDQYIPK